MNSLLAIALAAQAVVANPLARRQVTSASLNTTATATTTTLIESSVVFTETSTFDIPTATYSEVPTSTAGGSDDGTYWLCSFPGSSGSPTESVSLPETTDFPTDTITATLPEVTDTATTDILTDTSTDTDIVTDTDTLTDTDTASETVLNLLATTATATLTASTVNATSDVVTGTDSVTFTDTALPTTTDIPVTTDLPITTDFPITTATATGGGWGVSTYTIVGPETTATIECVRIPRRGGHHQHPPAPRPPHHGPGTLTWTGTYPTATAITLSSGVITDLPTLTTTTPLGTATSTVV